MYLYKSFSSFDAHSTKNTSDISTKILLRTKQLALSREKYHSFLNSHSKGNSSEKSIYEYPLMKIKMKHSESQKSIENKSNSILDKFIAPYQIKKIFKNRHLNNKRLEQFFISELNEASGGGGVEINKENFELNKKTFPELKKKFSFIKTKKNIYKRNFVFLNNIKPKTEKQIYLLIDSIFSEKKNKLNETKIKYDESEIFGYKEKYLNYLKEELNILHKGEKYIEKESNFSYEYENKTYGKIKLELNSINILITNKEKNKTVCSLNIPFDLVCLFYLSHIKELAYIILGIFLNENFKEYDENILLNELKEIIKNQIFIENNILKYKFNIDDEDKKIIFGDYLNRRNIKNRDNVKYNFLSLYSTKEAFKQMIFENCTFYNDYNLKEKIYYHSNNSETIKILFDTNINIINFSWISLNNNYNIKITMPKIIIKIPKFQKELSHFIHRELLTFLLMNKFSNFNYILIHYLFTLKKFRADIYKALSYNHLNRLYPFFNNIINNDTYNSKNLKQENYHITNLRFEEYENSLNDNEYTFYVSDSDNFHLYKMKSYTLFVYSFDSFEDKNPKIFFFNFSFYHMKVLFYKSKYDNLIQFLQRLLIYNPHTKKIFLDYRFFSSFKYMNGEQIDRYFKESSLNIKENMKNIGNEIIQDNLVLRVVEPKFISVSVKKKKIGEENNNTEGLKKVGNVGRKLIGKLIENDIKDWGKILWENKSAIEPLKRKSRNSTFVGKKNFKVIFKKFLKID